MSLLLNSAISWVWWGTAPPAPNVETPLQVKKTESAGLTADLDESAGLTAVNLPSFSKNAVKYVLLS